MAVARLWWRWWRWRGCGGGGAVAGLANLLGVVCGRWCVAAGVEPWCRRWCRGGRCARLAAAWWAAAAAPSVTEDLARS
eukprot:1852992-Prymnesium_polylepis.1